MSHANYQHHIVCPGKRTINNEEDMFTLYPLLESAKMLGTDRIPSAWMDDQQLLTSLVILNN